MKIAFFAYSPNILGGPSSWLLNMLPRFLRHGIEPIVCFLQLAPGVCDIKNRILNTGIPAKSFPNTPSAKNLTDILDWLRSEAVDLVLADHLPLALSLAPELHRRGMRVVMTLRSDEPYYHRLSAFFAETSAPWQADGLVAVSQELLARYQSRAIDAIPSLHCPSGTPMPTKSAHWDGVEPLRILYSGRIEIEQKCIDQLASHVMRQIPENGRWTLDFIGRGSYETDLKRRLRDSNARSIRLLPPLPHEQLLERLPTYHALLMGSSYEGLSTSLQEAMAAGLVPILRDMQSGLRPFFRPGENGLIFKRDFSDLRKQIESLLEKPSVWEALSRQARLTAEQLFDSDRCATRWTEHLFAVAKNPLRIHASNIPLQVIPFVYLAQKLRFSVPRALDASQLESIRDGSWLASSEIEASLKLDAYRDWLAARELPVTSENLRSFLLPLDVAMQEPLAQSSLNLRNWAILLAEAHEFDRAIPACLQAYETAELARDIGLAAYELGRLYQQTGDKSKATTWHSRCLEAFPDHRKASAALAQLT